MRVCIDPGTTACLQPSCNHTWRLTTALDGTRWQSRPTSTREKALGGTRQHCLTLAPAPSHGGNTGSNPVCAATLFRRKCRGFMYRARASRGLQRPACNHLATRSGGRRWHLAVLDGTRQQSWGNSLVRSPRSDQDWRRSHSCDRRAEVQSKSPHLRRPARNRRVHHGELTRDRSSASDLSLHPGQREVQHAEEPTVGRCKRGRRLNLIK